MKGAPWQVVFLVVVAAAGCDTDTPPNPTQPTPVTQSPPTPATAPPTRILRLTGESGEPVIDLGNVEVGQESEKKFLICNDGNAAMTLQDISGPDGFWVGWIADWDDQGWDYFDKPVAPGECRVGFSGFAPTRIGRYAGTVVLKANHTAGSDTIPIQGIGTARPGPPLTIFGEGTYLIGLVVAPDRYHADPNGRCYLGRLSRYPQEQGADLIAQSDTWSDPGHWIVDILPSDAAFFSGGCGWWDRWSGKGPPAGTVPHGVWEVNRQIRPGRYQTNSQPGCRWERLRHFQWTPDGVLERQEVSSAGTMTVDILRTDAGFLTSPECGVWTRVQ